ncbi:unnamed protein product [Enterobius vermicularis]|uniref:Sec7/BIG1-like C-terminal domain-containing protein n=1 Tax=Enterobius vermicularis TaxID=51028 RepID=A0A3P6HN18_ENTVE|nr:unnamed protein product [Enterobius vermicularis]
MFSTNDTLFSSLLVRCVVQLELVDAVNHIVFGSGAMHKDDVHAFPSTHLSSKDALREPSGEVQNGIIQSDEIFFGADDDGLFSYIGADRLLCLVNCLLQSHRLAQKFNGNNAQRTLLWKAGFKGRSKPNLLRQETHSVRSALGILYRLYSISSVDRKLDVKKELKRIVCDAINYFLELNTDQHKQAWNLVLHLILDCSSSFNDAQLLDLGKDYALDICRLVQCDMKEELRSKLARVLQKCISVNYM